MRRRPRIITNFHVRRMRALVAEGASMRAVAASMDCSVATVHRYIGRQPKPDPTAAQLRARDRLREQAERSQWVVDMALAVFPEARL